MEWRVLVVDDQRDNAEALGTLLGMMGHDVRCCHDGWSALDMDVTFRPHLVLLDLNMPGIDGHETARRMQAKRNADMSDASLRSPLSRGLIVALTGYARQEDRQRSRECGFFQHILKPVSPQTLRMLFKDIESLK